MTRVTSCHQSNRAPIRTNIRDNNISKARPTQKLRSGALRHPFLKKPWDRFASSPACNSGERNGASSRISATKSTVSRTGGRLSVRPVVRLARG
jgi:hypothetical protein